MIDNSANINVVTTWRLLMKKLILFLQHILLAPLLLCGGGGGGYVPTPTPTPTPSVQERDAQEVEASDNERRRKKRATSNTVLTGGQGLTTSATTTGKTLLGQ